MDEHLGELNLVEHASMLRVLERAKKRRGRKVGSKKCTGDAAAHQRMRHLKASNPTMSKAKAAQIAAKENSARARPGKERREANCSHVPMGVGR